MISIVIPMFNEENDVKKTLQKVSKVLKKTKQPFEIISVDDGSSDKTLQVLNKSKRKYRNLRVISHEMNKGPGAAFRTGFAAAKGDIIITMDADLSFSPEYIPQMLKELKDADVVIGSQHLRKGNIQNVPQWRIFVSKAAVFLDRLMLGVKLSSLSSFFVAYKAPVIKKIQFKSNSFDAQCEIIAKLYKKGYHIKEIPCILRWSNERKNRLSFKKLIGEILRRIKLWVYINRHFH